MTKCFLSVFFSSLSFQCWNSPSPRYFKGEWLMVCLEFIMMYHVIISSSSQWFIRALLEWENRVVKGTSQSADLGPEVCCWFPGGRPSSGLFCFSCQESWDGWKSAVFPGTGHHVSCLTVSTSLCFGQIYLGRFCVADQQLFPGSLAPPCLWATSTLVPGPCHIWCVICPRPPSDALSSPSLNSWRRFEF